MLIESDRLTLRKTVDKDIDTILKIERDNSEFLFPYSELRHKESISNVDELHLIITNKSDTKIVGFVVLAGLKNENSCLEFRRIVIVDKGKGYGRETIQLIKKLCFEKLACHRLWLDVFDYNTRAIAIYESESFKLEGNLRECIKKNNKYESLLLMSILKQEYQSSKKSPQETDLH